jgi:hypothetical protein
MRITCQNDAHRFKNHRHRFKICKHHFYWYGAGLFFRYLFGQEKMMIYWIYFVFIGISPFWINFLTYRDIVDISGS